MQNIKERIEKIFNVNLITKMVLVFILLQPVLDILSFLNIRNIIPIGISTYIKPLFVFGIGLYVFFTNKEQRKSYVKILIPYGLLVIMHCIILKDIKVENSIILHEIRFMINVAYMLVLYMIMDFLYANNPDRDKFIVTLKKTLVVTFFVYCGTIILAILTGTSGKTYEYSDASKDGFKGWLDSGQIFGHALSITLPFLIYYIFNLKIKNKVLNIICKIGIVIPITVLLLIGTKVTYFIALIVLATHFILDLIYFIKEKNRLNLLASISCLVMLGVSIAVYNYLPVKKNIDINNSVLSVDMSGIASGSETNRDDLKKLADELNAARAKGNLDPRLQRLQDYYNWDFNSALLLEKKYKDGSLHPSDMRAKQLVYNSNKYMLSSIQYKLFGLGYLNQPSTLTIERDSLMIIFCFGIVGFLTVLLKPILQWCGSSIKILKNLKSVSLETLYLFEGFSIFFCISVYAGYTFIYTNFSIFLVIICLLLKDSFNKNKESKFSKYFEKIYKNKKEEFYKELENNLINEKKEFIITANPETIMTSMKDENLNKAYFDAITTVVADGIGIVKGAKMLNYEINETIPGIDIANKLLEYANVHKKSIFLFGAKPEVINKMKEVIKEKYSNAVLVGAQDGYIENKDSVFDEMKKLKPDIVLVAMGIPMQEMLIYKHLKEFDKGIFVGIGGSFDVISGEKKRAPKIFIKLKLEWLYRIIKEPKRLKRFFDSNVKYILKLKFE